MNSQVENQAGRATLESWKEIAAYLQRDAKTARKWEKEEGLPIHRHAHNIRSSVYAYRDEIDRWRATRRVIAEPVARPLWKIPAFAVTIFLCLVMVGNGVRPQIVEADQGQTRTLICSGADCDGQYIAPDGKSLLAYINGGATIRDLGTNKVRTLAEAIPGTRICCNDFSPDGSRVVYSRTPVGPDTKEKTAATEVIVSNVDGTKPRTVFRGGKSLAWSPDGRRILVGQSEQRFLTNLLWVDIASGAVQPLPAAHLYIFDAKVSRDGKYVAFGGAKEADHRAVNGVYIREIDGSGEALVSSSPAYQEPIEWTPDGKYLLFGESGAFSSLWAAPVVNGRVQAAVDTNVRFDGWGFLGLTRSGAIYYQTLSRGSDIYTAFMDPASGRVTSSPIPVPLKRSGGNVLPRWAPDSRRLAYYWADPRTSGSYTVRELSVYSFETGQVEQASALAKPATGGICWSRDGASILYNSAEDPSQLRPAAYHVSTTQITQLSSSAKPLLLRSCSGDLVAGFDTTGIKVRSLTTGSEKEIYRFGPNPGTVLPVLSHDGRSVAFITAGAGVSTLHVVSSDGGPVRDLASTNAPSEIQTLWGTAWSPDDRFLYFARRPDSKSPYELLRVPAAGGTAESVGLKVEDIRDLDIAPDGTRIAFSIGAVNRPEIWSIKGFLPAK